MRRRDDIVRVGADLAASSVQVHAVDAAGDVVLTRKFRRQDFVEWCETLPVGCTVAFEACCGAHLLARQLAAAGLTARLIAPAFVTPYRMEGKTGKNDSNDAAAICEAASRPHMRFVPAKSEQQLAWLAVHRLRDGYIKERTACINRTRGLMYEFGLQPVLSVAKYEAAMLIALNSPEGRRLPGLARNALRRCSSHFRELARQIAWCDEQIADHVRSDPNAKLAITVRGVGPVGASAVAASLGDLSQFSNGRQFSAFLGLVPRQRSSGMRQRLGAITKRGDPYLRKLLVMGARSALVSASSQPTALARWASALKERIGWPKATVALANRNARVLWKTLATPAVSAQKFSIQHQPVASAGVRCGEEAGLKRFDPPFVAGSGDGVSPELDVPLRPALKSKATKPCEGSGDSET